MKSLDIFPTALDVLRDVGDVLAGVGLARDVQLDRGAGQALSDARPRSGRREG